MSNASSESSEKHTKLLEKIMKRKRIVVVYPMPFSKSLHNKIASIKDSK